MFSEGVMSERRQKLEHARDVLLANAYSDACRNAVVRSVLDTEPQPVVDHRYISDLTETVRLLERTLPGWWWRCGSCSVSGDADIGPDYNGPEGERLKAQFPPEHFDDGRFTVDLKPGDGMRQVCHALLLLMIDAHLAILEHGR
jgi:hypothetical protein